MSELKGKIHSIQSLGTLDGPGIRFVIFMQGCPLRCGCCHNPDTWDISGGEEYSPSQILDKAKRYREYFGVDGGITVSGGEPLLQAEFVKEIFKLCKKEGINTCLDTSGCILTDGVKQLLKVTDRVLLDIKYTSPELYKKHVGCELSAVYAFLEYLNAEGIKTTLRQVIIPTLNDNEQNILNLKSLAKKFNVVDKVELLPFKKICQVKYDDMGVEFPFKNIPTPSLDDMNALNKILGL